jgi:MFS family permease
MSGHREYPPYISYLIVTIMSVAMLAVQTTIPFKLKELGRGFDAVGFLFTWTSFWYIASGLLLGKVSHHVGPRRTMLITLTASATMVFIVSQAQAVWQMYAFLAVHYVAICLFWAATEHATTGLHSHLNIMQSTAIYGAAFTLGNAGGLLISTQLQRHTLAVPFLVAIGLMLVVFALTWITVSPQAGFHRSTEHDISAFSEHARTKLRRSLLAARIGIVGTYGTNAVAMLFLPRYLWEELNFSKPLAGFLTALVTIAMAATFAFHGSRTGWTHRLTTVRIAPFVAAIALLIVGTNRHVFVIALGAIIIGLAAGTAYVHNLYYALEEPGHRARRAGIHEGLVGVAFMVPTILSGWFTHHTGNPQVIFWVGAGFAVTLGLIQNAALMLTASSGQTSATRS